MQQKTYYWNDGGNITAIEVTFDSGNCNNYIAGPGGGYSYETVLTATILDSIPVDLAIDLRVTEEHFGYYDNSTYYYFDQIIIPANSVEVTVVRTCQSREVTGEGNNDTIYTYDLDVQKNVPDGASYFNIDNVKTDSTYFEADNGSIIVNTDGGVAPFNYAWSDAGPNSRQRFNLAPGLYSVTVTDDEGTQRSIIDIEIVEPPEITAVFTIEDAKCFGSATAEVSVVVDGGVGGYSYLWSDGSNQLNRVGIVAGNYTLSVTDANNYTKVFNVVIGQPVRLQVVANIIDRDVTVVATGGTAPYLYFWSDGVTVANRVDMELGTYSITVRDANNCQTVATVVIDDFKFYHSKNPVWLQLQADDPETKPNLSFLAEVWVEDVYESGNFEKKYSAEHPATSSGSTAFDMQEILNAFVELDLPTYKEDQIVRADSVFKRFHLKHTEKFGDPPVPSAFQTVETFFVLFGGLSDQEFAKNTFFSSYLDNVKPFLTWEPTLKRTSTKSHEFLHFAVVNNQIAEIHLFANIKYTDGSSQEQQLRSQIGVNAFEVYRIPAGYDQLSIGEFSVQEVRSYEIYLKDGQNNLISEKREFLLVKALDRTRVFMYQNSLGGWSTLTTFGNIQANIKTSEEVVDRKLPVNFKYSDRERVVISKSGQINPKIYIGNLSNSERQHLIDFSISEQVFEVTESGYLPVGIQFDFTVEDTYDPVEEIGFTVVSPTTRNYTPRL